MQKLQLPPNTTKLPCYVTHELLQTHNILVLSSVILDKEWFRPFWNREGERDEDRALWLHLLEQQDKHALSITTPLIVYDNQRNICDDPTTSGLLKTT